jgi:hypothetical protein
MCIATLNPKFKLRGKLRKLPVVAEGRTSLLPEKQTSNILLLIKKKTSCEDADLTSKTNRRKQAKKERKKKRLGDVSRTAVELQQDPHIPLFQLQNY